MLNLKKNYAICENLILTPIVKIVFLFSKYFFACFVLCHNLFIFNIKLAPVSINTYKYYIGTFIIET